MPTLSEKHDLFIRLNREDGAAIVALIDLKTEEDMDKVLNKLDAMQESFEAKFEGFDARLNSMEKSFDSRLNSMEKSFDSRLNSMEKGFDSRLNAMDQKLDTKINTLYWFVGIAVTLAVAVIRFIP